MLPHQTASSRVVALGEILWDLLPTGRQLGGAPANFICHVKSLGAVATLVSRVGMDELGYGAAQWLTARGFDLATLQIDPTAPTGAATVILSDDGQATFTIQQCAAWDYIEANPAAVQACAQADAVCFGTLAQRSIASRASIETLLRAAPPRAWRLLDINLRAPFYTPAVIEKSLSLANALKLNDQELTILAKQFALTGTTADQLKRLTERFELRVVALTRGSHGSLLFANGNQSDHPGIAINVKDTVGAGDAFTAALITGLLAGDPLDQINQNANEVAAYVCTQHGATPVLSEIGSVLQK